MFRIAQDRGESILFPIPSMQGDAGRITSEGITSIRELNACNVF